MKFIRASLVFLLLSAPAAFATEAGIEGGVIFVDGSVSVGGASTTTTSTATNFNGGVFANIPIGPILSFRPELLYQTQSPDFVAIPLMITFGMDFGPLRPFVFAGPDLGFRVGSAPSGTVNTFNLSADLGAGLDFWLNENIGIGGNWRYAFGLTNLSSVTNVSAKSRDMYLLGALTFRF